MRTGMETTAEPLPAVANYIHGRFIPGTAWCDRGKGILWTDSSATDMEALQNYVSQTCGTKAELHRADNVCGESLAEPRSYLVLDGDTFLKFAGELAHTLPVGWSLSTELSLYTKLWRLAAALVGRRDTIAYAAPAKATVLEVVADCIRLSGQEEDGWGRWSAHSEGFVGHWMPAWTDASCRALRMVFVSMADEVWRHAWTKKHVWKEQQHGRIMVDTWIWRCVDFMTRDTLSPLTVEEPASTRRSAYQISYRGEAEAVSRWRESLWAKTSGNVFVADGWLLWRMLRQGFQESGWREEWLFNRSGRAYYQLEFELVPPGTGAASKEWYLVFYVAHRFWSARAPLSEWWKIPKREWNIGREVLLGPDEWILPALYRAAEIFQPLGASLGTVAPYRCAIAPEDIFDLVSVVLPKWVEQGISVKTPSFEEVQGEDIRIRVRVKRGKGKQRGQSPAVVSGGWFDMQEIVDFDWTLVIDDKEVSQQEFEQMVEQQSTYVQLGGSWRLVPIQSILEQVRSLSVGKIASSGSVLQLTRFALMHQEADGQGNVPVEMDFEEEADFALHIMSGLVQAGHPPAVEPPRGFRGTLRHYQLFGFEWLVHLRNIGCGGCLADDMGLGKTIQILVYLMYLKEQGLARGTHLLICPTSLLANWKAEIGRFVPDLEVYVHHGKDRFTVVHGENALAEACDGVDLVMTTYATMVRDIELLSELNWDVVIADEAQNIKNAETKQAKAIGMLSGSHRIALTGTPVENRLEELWSIFQFTTPGYLGSQSWFRKTFVAPISHNAQSNRTKKLHRLLSPVLLRRRKTDPSIQIELPEKWELRAFASLTSEQAVLYQSIVNRLFSDIERPRSEIARRGQILSALVRLKQACNHPCLVVGGSGDARRSGKMRLLLDLLDDVIGDGEAALIFTQFRDMGELLCDAIESKFGFRPRFLHGGLSASVRGQIVDTFQSGQDVSPVLVLSLKAGGVGLNLTRANHVFHFDRWWNPAVEDQATDRAFRIGQNKDVQVHKFICSGTLEERIDELINSKRSLSAAVVGESEGWLTELDNDTLKELFVLNEKALEEDE